MPVILGHLIFSEEISLGPGKEWTYLGHFLLLAQWSGNARSGWLSAVEWMMQNVLPLCSLSSLQISNQSAFFLQSCKVFVVLCITSSVYRFALQGGVWKGGSMPFCTLKTLHSWRKFLQQIQNYGYCLLFYSFKDVIELYFEVYSFWWKDHLSLKMLLLWM